MSGADRKAQAGEDGSGGAAPGSAPAPDAAAPARLRDRIDRGVTGDKVAFSDPAAAPLGTDAEAAGAPSQATGAGPALSGEASRAAPPAATQTGTIPDRLAAGRGGRRWMALAAAVAAILAAILVQSLVGGGQVPPPD